MGSLFTVTRRGLEEQEKRFGNLADFKKIARGPVQAALDVVEGKQKGAIKRGESGKAQGSVGTHIHNAKWGVYGNSGPRGGRFGEGAVAAIMLDRGTGIFGPLHKRIEANARGTISRGVRKGAASGGVMTFAAYGSTAGPGSLFGARFGATAKSTTGRGRYKQQRFGALGKVFARSTKGMPAQPWAKGARSESDGPARSAFADALHQSIAEASRG